MHGEDRDRFAARLRDCPIDVVRGNLARANRDLPLTAPDSAGRAYELTVAELTTEELAHRALGAGLS